MGQRPITYAMIAEACGVSAMTVSRALNKTGRISAKTQERIEKQAAAMGYRRDPVLAAFAKYRGSSDKRTSGVVIGYVTDSQVQGGWRTAPSYRMFWEGAVSEAERLGYQVEEYWTNGFKSLASMGRILRARGVELLIIAPQMNRARFEAFDFEDIAAVSLGMALTAPDTLDRVSHDHYAAMLKIGSLLQERGYRRIGLMMPKYADQRTESRWSAGYLQLESIYPKLITAPPFYTNYRVKREKWGSAFIGWAKSNQLDAVVTTATTAIHTVLEDEDDPICKDLSIVGLDLPEASNNRPFAGITQNARAVGSNAVRLLDRRYQNREFGLRATPTTILIQGSWVEGPSIRSAQMAAAPTAFPG